MQDINTPGFRVLGPLEVRLGERPVPVRGWREHTVLALLLLADGDTVTIERLVEAVWDGDPPSGAVKAVRNCVSALRHRLATAGGPAIPVQSTQAGYRLPVEEARLDARDFLRQAQAGRHLADAGQTAAAAAGMRTALALWRGPALAGIESRIVQDCAARLDEQRMSVLEECLDLELALARHQRLIAELRALAAEYPLRERITGQLMLALYRSGRQAEALDAYHRLASRLAADLGLDASDEITRLHEAILRQDPVLNPQASGAAAGPRPPATMMLNGRPAGRQGTARANRPRRPSRPSPPNRCSFRWMIPALPPGGRLTPGRRPELRPASPPVRPAPGAGAPGRRPWSGSRRAARCARRPRRIPDR